MKNKKELIVNAAMSLIKKNGMAGLTVETIAKEAKIGKGTIYQYFDSKDEIFYETIKHGISICVDNINKKTFLNKPNHQQAICNFIDGAYEIVQSRSLLSFSSDSNLFAFEKDKIKNIQLILKDHYHIIIETANKINKLGIKENKTLEPTNPLTHFIFINMVFSSLFQKINGNIDDNIDIKNNLYEITLKLYN